MKTTMGMLKGFLHRKEDEISAKMYKIYQEKKVELYLAQFEPVSNELAEINNLLDLLRQKLDSTVEKCDELNINFPKYSKIIGLVNNIKTIEEDIAYYAVANQELQTAFNNEHSETLSNYNKIQNVLQTIKKPIDGIKYLEELGLDMTEFKENPTGVLTTPINVQKLHLEMLSNIVEQGVEEKC